MIYFFSGGLQEYFVLSSGSIPACCRNMSGAKISLAHKQFCSLQLYSQPWVVTLHFLMPFSTPTVSNIATQWWWAMVFISVWRALLCLCFNLTSPISHTHSHSHTCTDCVEDKYIHVILYLQDKKRHIAKPHPDFHSWQSSSGSVALAGAHIRLAFWHTSQMKNETNEIST